MSTLSRYNLLISAFQSDLRCKHNLGSRESDQRSNDLLISKSLVNWLFLSDDLMCDYGLSEQSRNIRLSNVRAFLNAPSISITLQILKRTYDVLICHISGKICLQDYSDFKGQLEDFECSSLGLLFSPIKESLSAVISSKTLLSMATYHSTVTRDMWRCAHYLQFLNKLNIVGIGLEASALADYEAAEKETAALDHASCAPYIPALSNIIKNWMKEWDYDGCSPHHGPGSVADSQREKLLKYVNLATDSKTDYLYNGDTQSIMPSWHKQAFHRISKLVFVPKNITKLRSISMEPATLQYLQQGCMVSLYEYFRHHAVLGKILKLQDQHQNRSFAYHGSITNDYVTIDLSHASDSVNWMLVKKVFCRVPKLLKWMLCTRSTHTELPDGRILKLSKFAPMGSALCFPVESLIFAGIAQLSVKLSRELALDRNQETGIRSNYNNISIYGDDIIVPAYAGETCVSLLKIFGFTPNNEKSYLSGPFKESCGGNYFCGVDITPIKFSPKYNNDYTNGISPESYTALCSYANLAYERGLKLFRLHCIKEIFKAGIKPIFSDSLEQSPAIFSPEPTNFHLRKQYDKDYQKYYYKYTGLKTVEVEHQSYDPIDEEIYLFDKLLTVGNKVDHASFIAGNGALLSGDSITFDRLQPYTRASLLPQTLKFVVCFSDI